MFALVGTRRPQCNVDHKKKKKKKERGCVSSPAPREALVKRHCWPANRASEGENDATRRQYFNLPLVSHAPLGTVTLFQL